MYAYCYLPRSHGKCGYSTSVYRHIGLKKDHHYQHREKPLTEEFIKTFTHIFVSIKKLYKKENDWLLCMRDGIQFNGHEFEQIPGDNEGQGSLSCCNPQGHKESETT